ncbi:DUF5063 domain-containing protein [Nocardioides nanhaiensis]|uniref:DUF5063 domain-containing protein n=1 Tax=Nocardioides nanhaiensis TaxID=1476871 RepID=A0ABP8WAY0_9ACTN
MNEQSTDQMDQMDQVDLIEHLGAEPAPEVVLDEETVDFAQSIADSVASFLLVLRELARAGDPAPAISLLLLEISQISLAGARLGAQQDFETAGPYQPDVGEEADLEGLRLRLATMLGDVDTYSFVFDPYEPEIVEGQLSDDLTSIASDLENGLRHHRNGDLAEALWWWQYSYVSSWGNLAGAALNALLAIVAHDRLDVEHVGEEEQIEAAEAVLEDGLAEGGQLPRGSTD